MAWAMFCANNLNQSDSGTAECNGVSGLVVHKALKSKALVDKTSEMSL